MDAGMARVPEREPRNNISRVRPRTVATAAFLGRLRQADPRLRDELAAFADSTGDTGDPSDHQPGRSDGH